MRHLASAQCEGRPAGGNTGRLFLTFGGPVSLDRVLTYKNLIYLLNLQFSLDQILGACLWKSHSTVTNFTLNFWLRSQMKGQTTLWDL